MDHDIVLEDNICYNFLDHCYFQIIKQKEYSLFENLNQQKTPKYQFYACGVTLGRYLYQVIVFLSQILIA